MLKAPSRAARLTQFTAAAPPPWHQSLPGAHSWPPLHRTLCLQTSQVFQLVCLPLSWHAPKLEEVQPGRHTVQHTCLCAAVQNRHQLLPRVGWGRRLGCRRRGWGQRLSDSSRCSGGNCSSSRRRLPHRSSAAWLLLLVWRRCGRRVLVSNWRCGSWLGASGRHGWLRHWRQRRCRRDSSSCGWLQLRYHVGWGSRRRSCGLRMLL